MNNLNRSLENSMDTIPNDRLRFYLLLLAATRKVPPLWLDVLLSVLDEYSGGLSCYFPSLQVVDGIIRWRRVGHVVYAIQRQDI